MDLFQSKLTKSEWESIEVPVDHNEKQILQMIVDGYDDLNISKNNTKWEWLAELKSVPDNKCISPKQIAMMITSKSNEFGKSIYIQIPRLKNPIPLFVLFRALNITSDKEICEKIVLDLKNPFFSSHLITYIGNKRRLLPFLYKINIQKHNHDYHLHITFLSQ